MLYVIPRKKLKIKFWFDCPEIHMIPVHICVSWALKIDNYFSIPCFMMIDH